MHFIYSGCFVIILHGGTAAMEIKQAYNPEDNVLSISVQGELDVSNIGEFKETLSHGIEQKSPNILLDCEQLKYIDSTGLGVLVAAYKKAKEMGGSIRIVHLKPYLKKIFMITALDKIFNIEVEA
jgi:anti-anti-sigma factor